MARYDPEPFKSDGGFTVLGLPLLFGLLAASGLVLGGIAGFISRWFYLIILFPAGIGLGLAGAGYFAGRLAKMRNLALAFLAGLFAGALAMGTMHFVEYRHFVSVRDEAVAGVPAAALAAADPKVQEIRAVNSFPAYLNFAAKEGVRIGRRGGGINLGYWGTWIYWSLELLGVTVLAMLGTIGGALQPFCKRCDSWKDEKDLGRLSGDPERAKALVEKGRLDELREHSPGDVDGALVLTISWCRTCHDRCPVDVKLQSVSHNDKGEEQKSELTHQTYPGEALEELEALFSAVGLSRRQARGEDRPRRERDDDDPPRRAIREDREDRDARRREDDDDDRPRRRERRDDY